MVRFPIFPVSATFALLALGAAPVDAASPPAPSPIHVDVTADQGTARVHADRVSVTAKNAMLLEAGGTITIRGSRVDINP